MESVKLILLFVFGIIQYALAYKLCFGEKLRRNYVHIGVGIITLSIILFRDIFGNMPVKLIIYVAVVLCTFFAQSDYRKKGIIRMMILVFFITGIEQLLLLGCKTIPEILRDNPLKYDPGFIVSILLLLLIVLLTLLNRKHDKENDSIVKRFGKKKLFIIVILMAIVMIITIAGLTATIDYIDSQAFKIAASICAGLSYCGVGILGMFVIHINRLNEEVELHLETEKKMNDMQKCYYEALLNKEEETRKYRHDMINHFICLNELSKQGETEKLRKYIVNMEKDIVEIHELNYVTGNKILDILTNYYKEKLPEYVKVHVFGHITADPEEMQLCIIYGNILQNAVEELQHCEGDAWLNIRYTQGDKFLSIEVENSISGQNEKERKKREKAHGVGMENVKKAVEEMGGMFEVSKDDSSFKTSVSLPCQNAVNHIK